MEIILAPRYLHKSILREYRKNDLFCDVKLVSKEELQKYCYPSFKDDALIYLMEKHDYNYEVCKTLLEYMPFINREIHNFKMDELVSLYDELASHDLLIAPIKNKNIYSEEYIALLEATILLRKQTEAFAQSERNRQTAKNSNDEQLGGLCVKPLNKAMDLLFELSEQLSQYGAYLTSEYLLDD